MIPSWRPPNEVFQENPPKNLGIVIALDEEHLIVTTFGQERHS